MRQCANHLDPHAERRSDHRRPLPDRDRSHTRPETLANKEERVLFLKKRTKKLLFRRLHNDPTRPPDHEPEQAKVFWFFFSKKNILTLL
jgi:hypothetical protein